MICKRAFRMKSSFYLYLHKRKHYAKKNQNHSRVDLLHRSDASISGFHRNNPRMARLDGKSPISSCLACSQFRSRSSTSCTYSYLRKSLLLCNLSIGNNAGHHFLDPRKDKKEKQIPFQLFSSQECNEICYIGNLRNSVACRFPFSGSPHSSI